LIDLAVCLLDYQYLIPRPFLLKPYNVTVRSVRFVDTIPRYGHDQEFGVFNVILENNITRITETFMMYVNVFYMTRNEILVGSDKK